MAQCCVPDVVGNAFLKQWLLQITAVVAIGLVKGISHVNWPKVAQILGWWFLTTVPVFLATAAFFQQGRELVLIT